MSIESLLLPDDNEDGYKSWSEGAEKRMELNLPQKIAAFRYGLIAPIVSRQTPLTPGELKVYFEQVCELSYEIPGSETRSQMSVRSLERYLSAYRKGGWDALVPKTRTDKGNHRLSQAVLDKAIALRKERPERSVDQIVFLLEENGDAPVDTLAPSTIARHLRKAGASRRELLNSQERGHRRFESEFAHQMWQADFQHTLYLPNPNDPGKRKKALLFAVIDDYSRVLVHAEFYWDERLPRLEDSLKKAILHYGVPEKLYVDNGAVFSSDHLKRICGRLGINLAHSRPYRPAGRGKIERIFQFIDTSFVPEAYALIENGAIQSLQQLNDALHDWLSGYYHLRKHGSTGQAPKERLATCTVQTKRFSIEDLTEVFLWEEERKVDKASCVSLLGNSYEVESDLSGHKVTLRYDPFDLSVIQVWLGESRKENARPLDLTRRHDRRVTPEEKSVSSEPVEHMSFFQASQQRRKRVAASETPMQYADNSQWRDSE